MSLASWCSLLRMGSQGMAVWNVFKWKIAFLKSDRIFNRLKQGLIVGKDAIHDIGGQASGSQFRDSEDRRYVQAYGAACEGALDGDMVEEFPCYPASRFNIALKVFQQIGAISRGDSARELPLRASPRAFLRISPHAYLFHATT